MRRHSGAAAVLLLTFLAAPAFADPQAAAAKTLRADIQGQIDEAEKKLTALAQAIPAEKYGWRPGDKVRSVGEVFMHVAGANYFIPTLWGAKVPAGVDPKEFDKDANDKAKVLATMKASFESVRKVMAAVPDADLDRKIRVFDHDGTVREAFLIVTTHNSEHLGQSIAYARMNGVVPPWSN
jgi:uncharacterized damage-inducible protein DinB